MGKNIVLIGMPGSGKTSVGQLLSTATCLPLVDTDHWVEEQVGTSIATLFAQEGEAVFRDWESRGACAAGAQKGVVIATGGGMILREENMQVLRQNGVIFFLHRSVEDIATDNHQNRPLIGADLARIQTLYEARIGLYKHYGEYTIEGETPEQCAQKILEIWEEFS